MPTPARLSSCRSPRCFCATRAATWTPMTEETSAHLRPKLIGARIKRTEDPRLLTGLGSFVDDRQVANVLHVAFRRSDHAHARIRAIDVAPAQAMAGVVAVFTAADLEKTVKPLRAT